MKTSINQLRLELAYILEGHLQMNTFFWGDFPRAVNEENINYPLMASYYPTAGLLDNQTSLPITIVIADKIYEDYTNLNDVESDTLQYCRDVFNIMNKSTRWQKLGRVESCSLTKFIEGNADVCAGHIMTVNFTLRDSNSICDLPMSGYDFDQDIASSCLPVQIYRNGVLVDTVASGGTFIVSNSIARLINTLSEEISQTEILAEATSDITAPNATYRVLNSSGGVLASGSIPSNKAQDITVSLATYTYSITDSAGTVLYSGNVTENLVKAIQDATVSNSNGSYSASVLAEGSLVLPDVTINAVNSNLDVIASDVVASVTDATLNIPDITFTDSDGTVSSVASGVNIVATPAPSPSGSTAMVLKSGYTTAGVPYDDAYYQDGRLVNRNTLSEPIGTRIGSTNPLLVSNTNRFTDLLFGQTYASNIALDWSTYDPSTETVVGYYTLLLADNTSWTNAQSLAHGKTFDGRNDWRVVNDQLLWNLRNAGSTTSVLNFAPFNITTNANCWTSTGAPRNSANAVYMTILSGEFSSVAKSTNGPRYMIYRLYNLTELGL